MGEKNFDRGLQNLSRMEAPKPEGEKAAEVLEFAVAVERIAERVLVLLKEKPLAMAALFGSSDSGKTKLVGAIMEKIYQTSNQAKIFGGEMKGYDEPPHKIMDWLPAVYFLQQNNYFVGLPLHEANMHRQAKVADLPSPDFTIVITNPSINGVQPEQFLGRADFIVRNPASTRKGV